MFEKKNKSSNTPVEINKRIKEIIEYYNLSQQDYADKIGVTKSTVSVIVNEIRPAGAKVILNTLEVFSEISCEWLIRGIGSMVVRNKEQDVFLAEEPPITRTQYKDLLKDIDELKTAIKKLKNDD